MRIIKQIKNEPRLRNLGLWPQWLEFSLDIEWWLAIVKV